VQQLFGKDKYNGYDGELIVGSVNGDTVFRDTTSGVMSVDGEPDVKFCVFDHSLSSAPFEERYRSLEEDYRVLKVPHHWVDTVKQLEELEQTFLTQGYEGAMVRDILGPYKHGRSTAREGWLLKIKRFEDSEALVLEMEERMHNANELQTNELGYAKRTSHMENKVPTGTMGALVVKDLKTGVVFNIGTGYTDEERNWWWGTMGDGQRRVVKYRYFPTGSKDKPRFPTYLGIRNEVDL